MRVAVIDLGTNTFHLLIADTTQQARPELIYHQTIAVKLGEGGISENSINPEAFKRGMNALKEFKSHIDRLKVDLVKSAATSGIRAAVNGVAFINEAYSQTGLSITIVTGEQEAELIYQGVRAAVNLEDTTLIVDIGGGSVEFIICDREGILWKKSYPIGAARLMADFHHSDPISASDQQNLTNYLGETLADLKRKLNIHQPKIMIGSAGVFESFADFQADSFKPSFERPEHDIDIQIFKETAATIINSTHNERSLMLQIPAVRVDMIVVATILTEFILDTAKISKVKLSAYSLKEGILFGKLI